VKLGIVTPVVTRLPRAHARWEVEAGLAEVERVVVQAERLGYDFCTCSEHVAVPREIAAERGGTYWDPLAVFGYLAAKTSSIRFATFVLVLAYHHPLAIVKRYGTLDRISGGRLVLGVGVGSLLEEFELLDAPFAGRGSRADDAIRALRACFGRKSPAYHGTHYDIEGFIVDPTSTTADVPIWIGGQSARSLRRAVELADAWSPFALNREDITRLLAQARETDAWAARARPLEVVLQPVPPFDPLGDPDGTRGRIERLAEAGATGLALRFEHHSPDHYVEQLEAMQALMPSDA